MLYLEESERWEKELRLGNLLLRKANRRVSQLEHAIQEARDMHVEFASLEAEHSRLMREIGVFQQELRQYECSVRNPEANTEELHSRAEGWSIS